MCDRDYEVDVAYKVWRRKGNPDLVNYDRCQDYKDADLSEDEAARRELRRQHPVREEDEANRREDAIGDIQ